MVPRELPGHWASGTQTAPLALPGSSITLLGQPGLGDVPISGVRPMSRCLGGGSSQTFLALGITTHGYLEVRDSRGASDRRADVGGWEVSLRLGINTCGHLVLGHVPDSGNCPTWVSGA